MATPILRCIDQPNLEKENLEKKSGPGHHKFPQNEWIHLT